MVLSASSLGAGIGPRVAERAGEIPVRMTLIWEFEPGAPARWLRMNNNRYATLPWACVHLHDAAEPQQSLR